MIRIYFSDQTDFTLPAGHQPRSITHTGVAAQGPDKALVLVLARGGDHVITRVEVEEDK